MNAEDALKVESMAAELRKGGIIFAHIQKLANHYHVNPDDIASGLLSRQVLALCKFTNFFNEGSPSEFNQLLKQQYAMEITMAEQLMATIQKANSVVEAAEKLQEEATRMLAKLRKATEERSK